MSAKENYPFELEFTHLCHDFDLYHDEHSMQKLAFYLLFRVIKHLEELTLEPAAIPETIANEVGEASEPRTNNCFTRSGISTNTY